MKIDMGCGRCKKEGYIGVDCIEFEGVDLVLDAGKEKWPWKNNSVEDVYCSHMMEHLEPAERIHFVNELYRVLKKGKEAWIQVPYWGSARAYGDLTHKWPPVTEFWPLYLNKHWRETKSPHNVEYSCDFDFEILMAGNPDFKQNLPDLAEKAALFINGVDDLVIKLKKK